MIDWHALDMEVERGRRDFERRVEEGRREILERIEKAEERCMKGQQRGSDALLWLMGEMTTEYLAIIRAVGEEMHNEFQETRAENRAQSDALLKMMDRLPPD